MTGLASRFFGKATMWRRGTRALALCAVSAALSGCYYYVPPTTPAYAASYSGYPYYGGWYGYPYYGYPYYGWYGYPAAVSVGWGWHGGWGWHRGWGGWGGWGWHGGGGWYGGRWR